MSHFIRPIYCSNCSYYTVMINVHCVFYQATRDKVDEGFVSADVLFFNGSLISQTANLPQSEVNGFQTFCNLFVSRRFVPWASLTLTITLTLTLTITPNSNTNTNPNPMYITLTLLRNAGYEKVRARNVRHSSIPKVGS